MKSLLKKVKQKKIILILCSIFVIIGSILLFYYNEESQTFYRYKNNTCTITGTLEQSEYEWYSRYGFFARIKLNEYACDFYFPSVYDFDEEDVKNAQTLTITIPKQHKKYLEDNVMVQIFGIESDKEIIISQQDYIIAFYLSDIFRYIGLPLAFITIIWGLLFHLDKFIDLEKISGDE